MKEPEHLRKKGEENEEEKMRDPFDTRYGIFGDIFSGLFGRRWSPHSTKQPQTQRDIRESGLIETFRTRTVKDKGFLRQVIPEYEREVLDSSADVVREYTKACLFAGDVDRAARAIDKLTNWTPGERTARGILAYLQGFRDLAEQHLRIVEEPVPEARLARSALEIERRQIHPAVHKELLDAVVDESAQANTILGTSCFNFGRYQEAERYFAQVIRLSPNPTTEDQLNLMRARVSLGRAREVYAGLSSFYHDTQCTLSPQEMTAELGRRTIDMPKIEITPDMAYSAMSSGR